MWGVKNFISKKRCRISSDIAAGKRGGFKNFLLSLIFFIIAAAIVFGIFKISGARNVDEFWSYVKVKTVDAKNALLYIINRDFDLNIPTDDKTIPLENIFPNEDETAKLNTDTTDNNTSNEEQESINKDSPFQDNEDNAGSFLEDLFPTDPQKDVPIDTSQYSFFHGYEQITYREAVDKLKQLRIADEARVGYSRADWGHWLPFDGTSRCWNVREEVLYRTSRAEDIILRGEDKKITTDKAKACYISGGYWIDPYSKVVITDPAKIDIDHVVPLGVAARSGGGDWNKEKKKAFANDVEDNLMAVSYSENRSKGDKGPGLWMPPNEEAHCIYAKKYINVLFKYGLTVTKEDYRALEKALEACPLQ